MILSGVSKTTIFIAGFSANASKIKRRVFPFVGLRGPFVADALKSYSVTSS